MPGFQPLFSGRYDVAIHDDQVHFCGDTCFSSYACSLRGDDTMCEQAVVDYIKNTNRDLFNRLQGLPFPTDHIPQSLLGQRLIYKARSIAQPTRQRQNQRTPYNCFSMLDGVGDTRPVVAAAEKAYNIWRSAKGVVVNKEVEGEFPTNSNEAVAMRKRKWTEIEDILNDIQLKDLKRSKAKETDKEPTSPSLVLYKQVDVSPLQDRYKKQGRDRNARAKEYYHRKVSEESHEKPTFQERPISLAKFPMLICYCRAPAVGGEILVTCSVETCLTGTFHLRCTNLMFSPKANEQFCCDNCANALGLSLQNSMLDVSNAADEEAGAEEHSEDNNYDADESTTPKSSDTDVTPHHTAYVDMLTREFDERGEELPEILDSDSDYWSV